MTTLSDTSTPDPPESYVPYVRRRNTPAQLNTLQQLFELTPHPTRAQRQALADETGMELKSVANWFQNKRQTSRRKSLSFKENIPPKTHLPHSPAHHRRSKTPFDRSKISLDHIAALSERPSLTSQLNLPRVPLTPRKSNVRQKNSSSPSELWTHMLSSPVVPPSSPDTEEARLAALSSRAKRLYSLEWACLKARQNKWADEDVEGLSTRYRDGAESRITLEPSATISPHRDASRPSRNKARFSHPDEDVEAAITLLGFKMRS